MPTQTRHASTCACGAVLLETSGPPIDAVACHCGDCQAAGRRIQALPGALPVFDTFGGTPFLVFRKDRMRPVRGNECLQALKLTPASPTTRYVATCCNALMYVGFDDARHWVSMHRDRFLGEVPAVRVRACIGNVPAQELPADLPCRRGYPWSFVGKLVLAGLAGWLEGRAA